MEKSGEMILEFNGVGVAATPPHWSELREIDFSLGAGDFVFIAGDGREGQLPLGDLAEGLRIPESGSVSITGREWTTISPTEAAALRGRIGRVFTDHGWLSNLDMDENITLVQRHFTTRPLEEIEREAEKLAVSFGLPSLPHMRPATMKKSDLRRAEWVRAFLGDPMLIILEHPLRDVYPEHGSMLAAAIVAARGRGAAVLWVDDHMQILGKEKDLVPTRLFRREGIRLEPGKED